MGNLFVQRETFPNLSKGLKGHTMTWPISEKSPYIIKYYHHTNLTYYYQIIIYHHTYFYDMFGIDHGADLLGIWLHTQHALRGLGYKNLVAKHLRKQDQIMSGAPATVEPWTVLEKYWTNLTISVLRNGLTCLMSNHPDSKFSHATPLIYVGVCDQTKNSTWLDVIKWVWNKKHSWHNHAMPIFKVTRSWRSHIHSCNGAAWHRGGRKYLVQP